MMQETKSVPVEIKAGAEGVIEAYAATFNGVDNAQDTIRPGAFQKTIAERGPQGSRKIKALLNHEMSALPIGTPRHMEEDSHGLLTQTKTSQTQMGRDVYTLAQEGAITELSIGYQTVKSTKADPSTQGYARELQELKLYEYSLLTLPACDERALITSVKSLIDLEAEIKRWETIASLDLKAGRVLSRQNVARIIAALANLEDVLSAAGVDEEAAETGTSVTATAEKSMPEPDSHSKLLTELKAYTPAIHAEEAAVLAELRSAFAYLGATP